MTIQFSNARIRKACTDPCRVKGWGYKLKDKVNLRMDQLFAAQSFDDLWTLPGWNLHPLKGDRAGEYSAKLDGAMRLIIEPIETDPDSRNSDGSWKWSMVTAARVKSIEDYHD